MAMNKGAEKVKAVVVKFSDDPTANQQIALNTAMTALAVPPADFDLRNQLGPMTSAFDKRETIDFAIVAMHQRTLPEYEDLNNCLNTIETRLKRLYANPQEVAVSDLFTANITFLESQLQKEIDRLKDLKSPNDESFTKLLDSVLVATVSSVPVFGPLALAAGQLVVGVAGAIVDKKMDGVPAALVGGALGIAAPLAYDPSASASSLSFGQTVAKNATGKMSGTGIITSGAAIVEKIMRKRLESKANSNTGGPIVQFNAADQGQAAANNVARSQLVLVSGRNTMQKAKDVALQMKGDKKTVQSFANAARKVFLSMKDTLTALAGDSIRLSFDPFVAQFDARLQDINQPALNAVAPKNHEEKIALVIFGYFYRKSMQVTQGKVDRALYPFVNARYHRGAVDQTVLVSQQVTTKGRLWGSTTTTQQVAQTVRVPEPVNNPTLRYAATQGPHQNAASRNVLLGNEGALSDWKKNTNKTKDFTNRMFYVQVADEAELYVNQIREVVAQTINRTFSGAPEPDDVAHFVSLVITCTCIISELTLLDKAGSDLEVPKKFIEELESLGYVTIYRKLFRVSDTKKKELTESGGVYKLRYPMGGAFSGSASLKEVAMVFIFANVVLGTVDFGRIALGLDSGTEIKNKLFGLIKAINDVGGTFDSA